MKNMHPLVGGLILILFLGSISLLEAQEEDADYILEQGIISMGSVSKYGSLMENYKVQGTFGQPTIGFVMNDDYIMGIGFWSFMQSEPQRPLVFASDGDYEDRINVQWNFGPCSPPPSEGYYLYRCDGNCVVSSEPSEENGWTLLAFLEPDQKSFQDFNVYAGQIYYYALQGENQWGIGNLGFDTGFVKPNGTITGLIQTGSQRPVVGARISLTPNLGKALEFDGLTNYILINEVAEVMAGATEFTFAAWVKAPPLGEGSPDSYTILAVNSGTVNQFLLSISPGTNRNRVAYRLNETTYFGPEIADDTWHHLAFTSLGSANSLYVDGEAVLTGTESFNFNSADHWSIGQNYGEEGLGDFFQGALDDISIWHITRSGDDIRQYMDSNLSGTEDGLAAYWKFDEGMGNFVFDVSPNEFKAEVQGGANWLSGTDAISPVRVSAFSDIAGNYIMPGIFYGAGTTFTVSPEKEVPTGSALVLDGLDDCVKVSQKYMAISDDFTIETWFKSNGGSGPILAFTDTIPNYSETYLTLELLPDGSLNAHYRVPAATSGGTSVLSNVAGLNDNRWRHTALRRVDGSLWLYIDGVLASAEAIAASAIADTSVYVLIGKNNSTNAYFSGQLDEIRIWHTARTALQISDFYDTILEGDETGLAAYWNCNEAEGLYLFDKTDNGYTGFIQNDNASQLWTDDLPLDEKIVHEFQPLYRLVTLTPSNTAADNINFTDITTVPVTGFVRIKNTDCFMDSVEIRVDGESSLPPTYSRADGSFVIDFDPGTQHWLEAYLAGHDIRLENGSTMYQTPVLTTPVAGVIFEDLTTRRLQVNIVGGPPTCWESNPLNSTTDPIVINIHSTPSCFEREILANDGTILIENLPPLKFVVTVDHPVLTNTYQGYQFDGQAVSLVAADDTLHFVHREPLAVTIDEWSSLVSCDPLYDLEGNVLPNFPVLGQGDEFDITLNINEDYRIFGGVECPVDTGVVNIFDDISDSSPRAVPFFNGIAVDTSLVVGQPNIVYPHRKLYQAVAADTTGRESEPAYQWAYVLGSRSREPVFTSSSPVNRLITILRDPPGDGSYSYFYQDSTYSFVNTDFISESFSFQVNVKVKGSPSTTQIVGLGAAVSFEVAPSVDWSFAGEAAESVEHKTIEKYSITFSEDFKTSGNAVFVGEDADLFIGYTTNVLYGITDVLEVANCQLTLSPCLEIDWDSENATMFAHTRYHIREHIIPTIQLLVDSLEMGGIAPADTVHHENLVNAKASWQYYLNWNDVRKDESTHVENISFDAGAVYQYTTTATTGKSTELKWSFGVNEDYFNANGFHLNDAGLSVEINQKFRYATGQVTNDGTSETTRYGFVLSDNDIGDFFWVEHKADSTVGSPVFEMIGGRSSCPWEKGTQPRDGVQFTPTTLNATNVPPDEAALWTLQLGNTSQSDEMREYHVRLLNATNPDGASVRLNGGLLGSKDFWIDPGGLETTLTFHRGPVAYDYSNVQIMLYSPCQYSLFQNGADALAPPTNEDGTIITLFADTLSINVSFIPHCSQVWISNPGENWFCDQDTLKVTLAGYDLESDSFARLKLQYRTADATRTVNEDLNSDFSAEESKIWVKPIAANDQLNTTPESCSKTGLDDEIVILTPIPDPETPIWEKAGSWINVTTIDKDTLIHYGHDLYIRVPWFVGDLDDGIYEIRAIAECANDDYPGNSAILPGVIERQPPAVLGEPQPADGVLSPGDPITVSFTEAIDCAMINPVDDIGLVDTHTSNDVIFDWSCYENTLIFTIASSVNQFYENHTLRGMVRDIADLYGNQMGFGVDDPDSVAWEFYVNRNPIAWGGGAITANVFQDETMIITRQLVNTGGAAMNFNFIDLNPIPGREPITPVDWLTVSPPGGTINPGSAQTITIEFDTDRPGGAYTTDLIARTSMGDEELQIALTVLCYPPDWEVNPVEYQYSMTITGKLNVPGVDFSTDVFVGAFIDNQVRGVTQLEEVATLNDTLLFLSIYSNQETGESISIRVYDARQCTELGQIIDGYVFQANQVIGDPENPEILTLSQQVVRVYNFPAGWAWFSFNMTLPDMSTNTILNGINAVDGDIIKSQLQYSQFVPGYGWVGMLDVFDTESMYMLKLNNPAAIEVIGAPLDVAQNSITIEPGWNWIAYQQQAAMDVTTALNSLPNAATGDLIKSQFGYAQYVNGIGWIGSLDYLTPGMGYLLKMTNGGVLNYPDLPGPTRHHAEYSDVSFKAGKTISPASWDCDPTRYEYNMTITGVVDGAGGTGSGLIGGFVNDECRGMANSIDVEWSEEPVYFLMIHNNQPGDVITFRTLSADGETEVLLKEQMDFQPDAVIGNVAEPYFWTLEVTANEESDTETLPTEFGLSQNFPNPFNPSTTINFALPVDSDVEINVYNSIGQRVKSLVTGNWSAGYHSVMWNSDNDSGEKVKSGVYFYRMTASPFEGGQGDDFVATRKLLLLK